jgi:D-sedoheptulose 7-phosphate isomerase
MSIILREIAEHAETVRRMPELAPAIEAAALAMRRSLDRGGKVFWCGNGGSAADSQHLAAELIGRFRKERPALASIALTTDSSILSSVANDYSYDLVFARQVEGLCRPGDVVVGLSTSGNSPNVLLALEAARRCQAVTVGMTGPDGGKMNGLCDHMIRIPAPNTARIQEMHIMVGHILCELIETEK